MSVNWRLRAACRSEDMTLFFAADGESPEARELREAHARAICHGCPVKPECLEFARSHNLRSGIWAAENFDTPVQDPPLLCGNGLHFMTEENTRPVAGTTWVRCRECQRDSDRRTRPARDARLRQLRRELQQERKSA